MAIDWGEEIIAGRKVHVFCAVLAWSRFRFVRFAADEQQATTLAMLTSLRHHVLGGDRNTRSQRPSRHPTSTRIGRR